MELQPGTPIDLSIVDTENKIVLPKLKVVKPKEAEPLANYGAMIVHGEDGEYYIFAFGNFTRAGWDKLKLPSLSNREIAEKLNRATIEIR